MKLVSVSSISVLVICLGASHAAAQVSDSQAPTWADVQSASTDDDAANNRQPDDVLSPAEWERVDAAVARALIWLGTQQKPDGSFPSLDRGQPGVTSLCVLAYLAQGHDPGDGEYGRQLDRATDFILSCQKENGLLTLDGPEGAEITSDVDNLVGEAAVYNHAISSLALSEMYGMGEPVRADELRGAIAKSLRATLDMQRWPKQLPGDRGGWRYVTDDGPKDSDLSVTGWQLMFLRSAKNAGFDVPQQPIDEATRYVRRTFNSEDGTFTYTIAPEHHRSRGMAGAGILALAHAGFHNSREAQRAGEWLLQHTFDEYNGNGGMIVDRYHYSLFNASQAMYQLGGRFWEQFFPRTVKAILDHQQPDGSWDAESFQRDRPFGNSYTTALVVLSLSAPNQFLPIFQR
jgi:hypothetical protein